MKKTLVVMAALAVAAAPAAFTQEEMEMPKPTPEHEALGAFVGEWAGEAEMKESPWGPGGTMTWTESCSWFADAAFNVVCTSEGKGPMGEMTGMGIMGYDANKGAYTHYGADSMGWNGYSMGKKEGETWTFRSKETMGDETFHSRFSMTMKSSDEMDFTWQMSQDGEEWMTMMEGTSRRTN